MTPEQALGKQLEIESGKMGWASFHGNVGKFRIITYNKVTKKNEVTWFDTGIPKGFPDYHIITNLGFTIYVETKIKPRKPSPDQVKWLNWLNNNGQRARVIYNIDEYKELIEEIMTDTYRKVLLDDRGNEILL